MRFPPLLSWSTWCRSLLWVGLGAISCPAAELDWGSVTWPTNTVSPTLSQTYNNVDGTNTDITFTFPTVPTTGIPAGSPNPQTTALTPFPGDGPNFTPKISTVKTTDPALLITVDFTAGAPNQYLSLSIDFSETVQDVSMTVYDIDFGSNDFQDLVIIRGITPGGTLVAPTTLTDDPPWNDTSVGFPGDFTGTIYEGQQFDPDLQASSIVGLNSIEAPDAAFGTWDFGTQQIDGLIMVYTNSVSAPNNPGDQAISFGNVFFTPVIPEAETYWAGGGLLFLLGLYEWRRRRARVID